MQILAQAIGCTSRQCGQLRKRFCGLRRLVEIAPPDAGEAAKVGDDSAAQFVEQSVVPGTRVRLGEEGFDRPEPLQEVGRQFDIYVGLSHVCVKFH